MAASPLGSESSTSPEPSDFANSAFFSGVSKLTMKTDASNAPISRALSVSDFSSSVQPPVNAFGNQARTTPSFPLNCASV